MVRADGSPAELVAKSCCPCVADHEGSDDDERPGSEDKSLLVGGARVDADRQPQIFPKKTVNEVAWLS
eukprot:1199315-Amphidinium_carterae.1